MQIAKNRKQIRPSWQTLTLIKSYSSLAELEIYESHVFEVIGHNWKMILHLRGKKEANSDWRISLYVAIAKTEDLPAGWEMKRKRLKRYHVAKTQQGFDELLPTDTFEDVTNGYLVDDSCAFGAEIFVYEYCGNWECVSPAIKDPSFGTYAWKLCNFSKIGKKYCDSESFIVEGTKWNLRLHANGSRIKECLSIFLILNEDESTTSKKRLQNFAKPNGSKNEN
ncbi:uncharacterized protein LOC129295034 [Prosopis cineraria]|uniref:uncharacterized protein LOC129286299 n=1 Tax=Prosopis cineraria TaxID=364024 RepID=UPI00241031E5|nr:uncharacterized protein LOC129286299 [Prosopis cineraria]XP_054789490.1 uncharacterized protein LOC129295034 [Prosopis cineraria]